MHHTVTLFILPAERCPGGPPEPGRDIVVEAETLDRLREVTRARLAADGYRVRSISFGPEGLVAYAEKTP